MSRRNEQLTASTKEGVAIFRWFDGFVVPGKAYHTVELGPTPGLPSWHEQSGKSRFHFPTEQAALSFAEAHKVLGRDVVVSTPNGKRFAL